MLIWFHFFSKAYFFVSSLHLPPISWLFFVLFTLWPCVCFSTSVALTSCLIDVTSIVNSIFSCCWDVELLSWYLTTWFPLFLVFYFKWTSALGNHPHCFLCDWCHCFLKIKQAASCFIFICNSFFKWNPSESCKIASHGKSMFLCNIPFIFPFWPFSCCTPYTKLSFPLQYFILQDLIFPLLSV